MLTIRRASTADLPQVTEIYNDAIEKTTATFDTEPKTPEQQQSWFSNNDDRHPVLVAAENGLIAAWASLSRWSDRNTYADTAEISVYVREEYRRKGIGKQIMAAIIQEGKTAGLHTVIASIAGSNKVSVDLCLSLGFQYIGTMREVGKNFDTLLDVHLMQLIY